MNDSNDAGGQARGQDRDGDVDQTRRRLLFSTGVTAAVVSACGFLGATTRYLSPNVLY